MADWLWNPRPLYTHIGAVTHFVGPQSMVEYTYVDRETGLTIFGDAIGVCNIQGKEANINNNKPDCDQCKKLINLARTGADVQLGSLKGKYLKPTPLETRRLLEGIVSPGLIDQVLSMDLGDRLFEATEFNIKPSVAAKRLVNDVARNKTFWPLALRLMWLESTGQYDFQVLRSKYESPPKELIVVESKSVNYAYL